jgi:glycosyltransferase involved in cell wall biosynthesis
MRVLQISSAVNFGGGEKHLTDLCRGLTGRGHEVFLAARPGANWLERLSFLPEENFFRLPLRNSLDVFTAGKFAALIRESGIEIVHAHLARDYTVAALAARLARSQKPKLVLTLHVLFPLKAVQKKALSNVDSVIAVSSAVEANLQKTFPPAKIVSVPNGIDVEKWSEVDHASLRQSFRAEHNIPPGAPLVGAVGELKPLKGQEDFVLATQIVAERFRESRFVMVGKDNSAGQNFRRKLKRMVKIFGLEERFLWLDWVEETAEILHSLDVFVSASHSESFGLSILEAMASGACAIVATETEGARTLLENDVTGKLVPVAEPVRLASAIMELLENENLRAGFASRAQVVAREKFSLERMIDETEKIYRQLLR